MDGIDLLRAQALTRRNARILAAKREYNEALKAIQALARKLRVHQQGRPPQRNDSDFSGLQASVVAREILNDGKALTLVELTLEVQARGCRVLDDPRVVANTIRSTLYRDERFKRDGEERWAVVG